MTNPERSFFFNTHHIEAHISSINARMPTRLFAILKINPAPFCVLDEIEAALDDVNVYRFAEYLKKFSKNTQFLVITHRKGTMEAADTVYGVTMEENGISKLLSMKLAQSKVAD